MMRYYPIGVWHHRDTNPTSKLCSFDNPAFLTQKQCTEAECSACKEGRGGFEFKWVTTAWYEAYKEIMHRDFKNDPAKGEWHMRMEEKHREREANPWRTW